MSDFRILLQTDIVDSTGLTQHLSDQSTSALWSSHDRVFRDLLAAGGGLEIDKSDGFLVLFDAVDAATEFTVAYHLAIRRLFIPLRARAGIHAAAFEERRSSKADIARGAKPIEIDGAAKPLTARLASLAGAGQTLLSASAAALVRNPRYRIQRHGHWRFQGFTESTEVYEIGDEDGPFVPPADSSKAYQVTLVGDLWVPTRQIRHSLPAERDQFVGQGRIMQTVVSRLATGIRLVTLVGIGGVGKTRLAQRFGWAWLGEFPGGVWFCNLSQARTLDGLLHAVSLTLDVPVVGADPAARLGNAIAGRGKCLLILDNFEQLVELSESTVGQWLERAPQASFLATSRQALGIVGEATIRVPPLSKGDATDLFSRRAESANSEFNADAEKEQIEQLVELLDFLPLAIELAAARATSLSARALLSRMTQRFKVLTSAGTRVSRQATLRATIDWSWNLLSDVEKSVLGQLSVFEGGFTHEALEAVVLTEENAEPQPLVDLVDALVRKSLVRTELPDRFTLFRTVQEYAAEQLGKSIAGQGDEFVSRELLCRRHAAYFSSLDLSRLDVISRELDNIVAACRWATAAGDASVATSTLEAAWSALKRRGPVATGFDLSSAVRSMPSLAPLQAATVEIIIGRAEQIRGQSNNARQHFLRALDAAVVGNYRLTQGSVLSALAELDMFEGHMESAASHYDAALSIARDVGDVLLECEIVTGIGTYRECLGQLAGAVSSHESALQLARSIGAVRWEGGCLGNLGQLFALQGLNDKARASYERALLIATQLSDRQWAGNALCNIGWLEYCEGHTDEARRNYLEALALARDIGHVRLECVLMCNIGLVHDSGDEWPAARAAFEGAIDLAHKLKDPRLAGQFLNYLGRSLSRQGQHVQAREHFAESERLLLSVSDQLNLALLKCNQCKAEILACDLAAAETHFVEASRLTAALDCAPESELGIAFKSAQLELSGADASDVTI